MQWKRNDSTDDERMNPVDQAKSFLNMKHPHTVDSLAAEFRRLGLKEGMTVIVHSSLTLWGLCAAGRWWWCRH